MQPFKMIKTSQRKKHGKMVITLAGKKRRYMDKQPCESHSKADQPSLPPENSDWNWVAECRGFLVVVVVVGV